MSEFLGIVSALATLAGSGPPVVLGPVVFNDIEVPQELPWGGSQQLIIHKLPGGARVVDAVGRDDLDLAWTGYLEGPEAIGRALQLDQLRVSGLPYPLTWDSLNFTVIVREFIAHQRHANWIPYSIKCVVLVDNSASFGIGGQSLLGSLGNDLASALNVALPVIQTVQTAIGVAQTALGVVGAVTKGGVGFTNTLLALSTAQAAVGDALSISDGTLAGVAGGVAGIAGILGTSSAQVAVSRIATFVGAAGQLAGTLYQSGFLNRATINLNNASS